MLDSAIIYWASVVACLGWLYSASAALWPQWFERGAVQHGVEVPDGYRVGWMVHWRLPARAAWVSALLSTAPLLTALFPAGGFTLLGEVVMTSAVVAVWFVAPPGMRLSYAEPGAGVFTSRTWRPPWRTLAVLAVFGLVPALGLGVGLGWLLTRLLL